MCHLLVTYMNQTELLAGSTLSVAFGSPTDSTMSLCSTPLSENDPDVMWFYSRGKTLLPPRSFMGKSVCDDMMSGGSARRRFCGPVTTGLATGYGLLPRSPQGRLSFDLGIENINFAGGSHGEGCQQRNAVEEAHTEAQLIADLVRRVCVADAGYAMPSQDGDSPTAKGQRGVSALNLLYTHKKNISSIL